MCILTSERLGIYCMQVDIINKANRDMKKQEVSEYMRTIGKRGGAATAKKYGNDHMREIARKGWKAGIGKKSRKK